MRVAHADAGVEQLQRRVVERAYAGQQVERLPHEADLVEAVAGRLARRQRRDVAPADEHLPAVGLEQRGHDLQQCRLPGSLGP
ncbi:MAG TPA: hypothetical protein VGO48_13175 [Conexibacter sp.]|nr:hypothetical protein [Conexibacter sp.]